MAEKVEVLSQTLAMSSLVKLTTSRSVLRNKIDLFPPELLQKEKKGKAGLRFLEDGTQKFLSVVTVSLQSVSTTRRLVFLQKGWKKVVKKLRLRKGDELSIFLLDRNSRPWTYSIHVEKGATTEREAEADVGGHDAEMVEASVAGAAEGAIGDSSGLQLLADCTVTMVEETFNERAPPSKESDLTARPSFDLNLPPMDSEF
ncbi:hypothetical protein SLEP1_g21321 [Rubroshorea leprosula]|uniref:TF-B3 domain-containing protein n=1 Tax=Rubroshorea leprosula TaxID=152421 RepID=A0AAV5JBN0_9ROSI|nr:hypothetical protein SLEP1_g21321 [Rubroshorea leprosula]